MPLAIRIPESIAERIVGVEPSIVSDVQSQLALLAEKPKLGTPWSEAGHPDERAFDFRVDRLPMTRVFSLLYVINESENTLDVVDFGVRDTDGRGLLMPTFRKHPAPVPVPPRAEPFRPARSS